MLYSLEQLQNTRPNSFTFVGSFDKGCQLPLLCQRGGLARS